MDVKVDKIIEMCNGVHTTPGINCPRFFKFPSTLAGVVMHISQCVGA